MAKIKDVAGKTIKEARLNKVDASDSCSFLAVELDFTDGSMLSLQLHSKPVARGMLFKSNADDDAKELRIVL